MSKKQNIDFVSIKNREQCYNSFSKIIKKGLAFKTGESQNGRIVKYRDQNELARLLIEPIPLESQSIDAVIEECEQKIITGSVNFSSPNFLAFPDCGNSTAALCGHMLYGLLNQNMINSMHCSPTATFVEITTINWLRELIGYEVNKSPADILEVGGLNVPGGTLANTVALLLARERIAPNTMKNGLSGKKPLKMFIPEGIGHYTSKAAMSWLGIGQENIVEVKTTSKFTIDQKDLVKKIKEAKKTGTPFAVIAYAGDSRTMAIDDFAGVHKIAKKYGLWFHIDACHGASLCFSKKLKNKVRGINLADSVTLDPHKVLFTPYSLSYVLVKNPSDLQAIAGVSDLITKEKYSFGQITPFLGSRSFNSLKFWFLMKHLGKNKIGKMIEKRHQMVEYFANLVRNSENFYVLNNITINSAVYIYVPRKLKQELENTRSQKVIDLINQLNLNIQKRMFKEGQFYVHTFLLNDFKNILKAGRDKKYQVQRLMLGNPLTTKNDLRKLMQYTERIAKEESEKLNGIRT